MGLIDFDEAAVQLCSYFDSLGVTARVNQELNIEKWGLEMSEFEANASYINFELENANIDLIRYGSWYHSTAYAVGSGVYKAGLIYILKCYPGIGKQNLKAKTKIIKEGLIPLRKQPVDFKWEGGMLADILNTDTELKESLYDELGIDTTATFGKANKPPVTVPRTGGILIRPGRKTVNIYAPNFTCFFGQLHPKIAFPSKQTFRAYKKIAEYIRNCAN
jgi:hypothetical protein